MLLCIGGGVLFFSILLECLFFTGCPTNIATNIKEVTITIAGDENIILPIQKSFKVAKGAKWSEIKTNEKIKAVGFKPSYKLKTWHLQNKNGMALNDSYSFTENATVFAVSISTSVPPVPPENITLTIAGDNNVVLPAEKTFTVAKGAKWSEIKTNEKISHITFDEHYTLKEWRLTNKDGKVLADDTTFTEDATVFAVSISTSVPPVPPENITLTIAGDNNVVLPAEKTFTVAKGAKWSEIKTNEKISHITFNEHYTLKEWRLTNKDGKVLDNDTTFTEDATVFALSEKPQIVITIAGDNNVVLPAEKTFKVAKGAKWSEIKTNEKIKAVGFKPSYKLKTWHLQNKNGMALNDSYSFTENATVFAVSQPNYNTTGYGGLKNGTYLFSSNGATLKYTFTGNNCTYTASGNHGNQFLPFS